MNKYTYFCVSFCHVVCTHVPTSNQETMCLFFVQGNMRLALPMIDLSRPGISQEVVVKHYLESVWNKLIKMNPENPYSMYYVGMRLYHLYLRKRYLIFEKSV
jgi:hypothetical protein